MTMQYDDKTKLKKKKYEWKELILLGLGEKSCFSLFFLFLFQILTLLGDKWWKWKENYFWRKESFKILNKKSRRRRLFEEERF